MLLEGKKGLVLNVTNKFSIGWACAEAAVRQGAEVGVGAQNERIYDKVVRLADQHERMSTFTVDFSNEEQMDQLVQNVARKYGKIDFLVHSAAYAPKEALEGRFIDTDRDAFAIALDISCFSFIALCRLFEPFFNDNASVMCMSYLGATRAVDNYNVMGAAKAALESSVRYLSQDLGVKGVRVNTISPGPINTVAARGVKGLPEKIAHVQMRAPLKKEFGRDEVSSTAVYLMSDLSRGVSGQIIFVDCGYNSVGV